MLYPYILLVLKVCFTTPVWRASKLPTSLAQHLKWSHVAEATDGGTTEAPPVRRYNMAGWTGRKPKEAPEKNPGGQGLLCGFFHLLPGLGRFWEKQVGEKEGATGGLYWLYCISYILDVHNVCTRVLKVLSCFLVVRILDAVINDLEACLPSSDPTQSSDVQDGMPYAKYAKLSGQASWHQNALEHVVCPSRLIPTAPTAGSGGFRVRVTVQLPKNERRRFDPEETNRSSMVERL